jgi:hypothetical protein
MCSLRKKGGFYSIAVLSAFRRHVTTNISQQIVASGDYESFTITKGHLSDAKLDSRSMKSGWSLTYSMQYGVEVVSEWQA